MAELGLKMYRFSIAWARIIPDGDGAVHEEGIKFYDRIIDCLLSRGIQPFVTLYHFDLPYALAEKIQWLGITPVCPGLERYARICFRAFGDRVKYWQVHNEQNLMVRVDERMNIDAADKWEADWLRAQMDYHMFLAHALAVKACHELVSGGKIGPAVSSCCTYPKHPVRRMCGLRLTMIGLRRNTVWTCINMADIRDTTGGILKSVILCRPRRMGMRRYSNGALLITLLSTITGHFVSDIFRQMRFILWGTVLSGNEVGF